MFRKKKRWLLFFAMTFLPTAGPVVTSLSRVALTNHPFIQAWWPYLIYAPVIFLAGCVAYYSVITPMHKMEPVAKEFLDRFGGKILTFGERQRINPRINILLGYPKTALCLPAKILPHRLGSGNGKSARRQSQLSHFKRSCWGSFENRKTAARGHGTISSRGLGLYGT